MKHTLVATLETVMNFQAEYRDSGVFHATMPIHNPKEKWPEQDDVVEIKALGTNVVLIAFVRTIQPSDKVDGDKLPRLEFTAGVRIKPFGQSVPAQSK